MVLAGRYRIIGLIGRGGMGEVYRADDLKLGQPVALKFLPKTLADDPVRRERLFAEVRIARQVSHPNICRVYDISEFEGHHFLTMEYIDGEDLASLLKRIGSLHGAKALDIARQLCAGMAAAHDRGVLHRDLKPANVMIDGRGYVRITDFGLAVAAGDEISESDVSGTPPYMAPEQFTGKGASVRSDIYALGLVFYEIFTGKRAFAAKTMAELRAKKETASPTAPSEIVRDIDPIVERVILRCIEKDPRQRPASAAQVASALPGGDPLAAAIAAGETPSPEMVAASGGTGGVRLWIAWACLAFIILGLIVFILQGKRFRLYDRVSLEEMPEVMVKKAQDILKNLGYPEPPVDCVYDYMANNSYLGTVVKTDHSPTRFRKLPALAVQFWYRQSPQKLAHSPVSDRITDTDPPLINGEFMMRLDSRGNLTELRVMPPSQGNPPDTVQPPDWSALFKAAGLDPAKYPEDNTDWSPLAYADAKKAWKGTLPDFPNIPIRIEAAAWQGKPVLWRLIAPFPESKMPASKIPGAVNSIIGTCFLLAGAFFVRRNLRMGRGDRRGATRLAVFVLILNTLIFIFIPRGGSILFPVSAALFWLMYIALEPFVRRRWPGMLVGWSRLLAGNYRDPLVGRDLLFGCVGGLLLALWNYGIFALSPYFGFPQPLPVSTNFNTGISPLDLMLGTRIVIVGILGTIYAAISVTMTSGYLLFLFRVFTRSTWISAALFVLLVVMQFSDIGNPNVLMVLPMLVVVHLFLIFRFGLLAWMAEQLFFNLLGIFPITADVSAWYAGYGITGLVILLAFTFYAFHTSLGGQPLFGRTALED
jgi:hypothetical protein